MLEHAAHLAVLALAQGQGQPDIVALEPVDAGLDRAVGDAVDGDPLRQGAQLAVVDLAERAHPVAAQPAGGRQLQPPLERTVVGEQEQPFRADVEPADRHQARQPLGQGVVDRGPPFRVARGGHHALGLVVAEQAGGLGRGQELAVDGDPLARPHPHGRGLQHHAVDRDAPGGDPGLGVAARAQAGPRDQLGDPLRPRPGPRLTDMPPPARRPRSARYRPG